jgi:hypothetical protein
VTSGDPQADFLRSLRRSLPGGWLFRRRVICEIRQHLEDSIADTQAHGVPTEIAIRDALARLGEVELIAGSFHAAEADRLGFRRRLAALPTAWFAVIAMSGVTLWAIELPQASGAKPPARHTHLRANVHRVHPPARPRHRFARQ